MKGPARLAPLTRTGWAMGVDGSGHPKVFVPTAPGAAESGALFIALNAAAPEAGRDPNITRADRAAMGPGFRAFRRVEGTLAPALRLLVAECPRPPEIFPPVRRAHQRK